MCTVTQNIAIALALVNILRNFSNLCLKSITESFVLRMVHMKIKTGVQRHTKYFCTSSSRKYSWKILKFMYFIQVYYRKFRTGDGDIKNCVHRHTKYLCSSSSCKYSCKVLKKIYVSQECYAMFRIENVAYRNKNSLTLCKKFPIFRSKCEHF